jgi:hypothetical protein
MTRTESWEFAILPSLHRGVAQPGSAHAWGACGRRFKSSRPDSINKNAWVLRPGIFVYRAGQEDLKGVLAGKADGCQVCKCGWPTGARRAKAPNPAQSRSSRSAERAGMIGIPASRPDFFLCCERAYDYHGREPFRIFRRLE